jgi:large subunit ribosomal protein L21
MYAIIRTGGKQYTVKPGDVLQVEKLDKELGTEFTINEVLLVGGDSVHTGKPLVQNASVTVVVTKQAKTRKILVFKKKRRHSYRKFATHRQLFTEIFVKSITSPDGKVGKTDATPNVIDVDSVRAEKAQARMDDRTARVQAKDAPVEKAAPKKAPAKKKVAKKAAPKKAKASKTAAKKKTAKKSNK